MILDRRADAEATVFRSGRARTDRRNAAVANGLALRHLPKPNREDYDRRGRFLLDSLRPRP